MPDTATPRTLGEYVHSLRDALGETQAAFAGRLGITQTHLSRLEHNHSLPSASLMSRMSERASADFGVMKRFVIEVKQAHIESHAVMGALRALPDMTCFSTGHAEPSLTPEEEGVLRRYRLLPIGQKKAVLSILESLAPETESVHKRRGSSAGKR